MLGRISQAEEFRAPVLFLLADGSSYMMGAVRRYRAQGKYRTSTDGSRQDLRVDGGHCAW
jgi:hypothetical protein